MRPNRHQIENMRSVVWRFVRESADEIEEYYGSLSVDRRTQLVARDFVEFIGVDWGIEGCAIEGVSLDGRPVFRSGSRDGSDFVFETVRYAVLPFVREALRNSRNSG